MFRFIPILILLVQIAPAAEVNWRKVYHFSLGGIALFLIGLMLLKTAFKSIGRFQLKKWAESYVNHPVKFMGSSIIFTFLLQSSSSFSYFVLGFVEMQILQLSQVAFYSFGANIGSGVIGFLLHFDVVKNSLFIVVAGVTLGALFKNRMELKVYINGFIGFGLLLYSAHLIKNGFSPLSDHPSVSQIFSWTQGLPVWVGVLILGVVGAAFCFVLRSASLALIVVITLAQTTQALNNQLAMALLMGLPLGSMLTLNYISRNREDKVKKFARIQLWQHLIPWSILVILSGYWMPILESIIPIDSQVLDEDSKIIFPNKALFLSLSYMGYASLLALMALSVYPFLRSTYQALDQERKVYPIKSAQEIQKLILKLIQSVSQQFESMTQSQVSPRPYHPWSRQFKSQRKWLQNVIRESIPSATESERLQLQQYHSFVLEFERIYSFMSSIYHSEYELAQVSADEINRTKIQLRKNILEAFDLLHQIIEDRHSVDLTQLQYHEIEINRIERKAHRQLLENMGSNELDQALTKLYLKSYSQQEQLANVLYRCGFEILQERT